MSAPYRLSKVPQKCLRTQFWEALSLRGGKKQECCQPPSEVAKW